MTVEEYFHLEEADTENRYEYIDGQIYMMTGEHSTTAQLVATFTAFFGVSFAENHAVFTILI